MSPGHKTYENISGSIIPLQDTGRPIAIVDDNKDDLRFLKREVESIFGPVPIVIFENGAGLIRHLHTDDPVISRPWLILLDLNMPRINGFRTLEILRGNPLSSDIPVVVVSGTLNEQDIYDSFSYGARAFLPKPVSREAFTALLQQGPAPRAEPVKKGQ